MVEPNHLGRVRVLWSGIVDLPLTHFVACLDNAYGRRQPLTAPEGRRYVVSPLRGVRAGRIGGMAFSFFYLAVRALLGALVRNRRGLHV